MLAPEISRANRTKPERRQERIAAELRSVLTGSSAGALRHGAANLLTSRLVAAHMPPFMASELGDGFNWIGRYRSAWCPWCGKQESRANEPRAISTSSRTCSWAPACRCFNAALSASWCSIRSCSSSMPMCSVHCDRVGPWMPQRRWETWP